MPIYEYRCAKCGEFEVFQRITDPALKRCPTCHAKVSKLISSTSFQLKGSGWYITDYGRKESGAAKSKPSKDSGETRVEGSTSDTSASTSKSDKTSKPTESAVV
ncbi:MAG: zinc ribbon domain-containing protein [Candidatus Binatia bacterium]